jgi:hypothetical protein
MYTCCPAENEKERAVIESGARRKKRAGLDVFQFAETVEPEAWGDLSRDLQVRLDHYLFIYPLPPASRFSRTAYQLWSENKHSNLGPSQPMTIQTFPGSSGRTFLDIIPLS